jgi:hypothetical protein
MDCTIIRNRSSAKTLTSKQVVLQAPLCHELVHEQQLVVVHAVAQEFNQIGMRNPPKEIDFRLQWKQAITFDRRARNIFQRVGSHRLNQKFSCP